MALLLIVIAVIAEIAVWIGVAHFIGGWWVFLLIMGGFFLGLNILRRSMGGVMPQLQQMQMTGQVSQDPQVAKKLPMALAGFLLMLPGLITDVLAVLVLIPAVQRYLQKSLMSAMQKRQQSMMEKMMGGFGGMNGGMAGGSMGAGGADIFEEMMRQMQGMQQGDVTRSSGHQSNVIDGEARHVEPDVKRIKSANDE